jgi:predicted MFS family arabinose efflux permease
VRLQVSPADLPQAISLGAISFNLARSVGPALGGVLISLWSSELAFAINAISYLGMIVVLARWNPPRFNPRKVAMIPAIVIGLDYCRRSLPIRRVLVRGFCFGVGAIAFQALLPAFARDRLHGGEIDYGLMLGAFGVGSIVIALWVSQLRRRFGAEAVVIAATLSSIVGQLIIAEATDLASALPACFAAGAGFVAAMTSLNVAMQLRSQEAILGRCLSIYQATTFGGMALGAWGWGAAADWLGLPFAIHAAAAWLALTVALHWLAPMPRPGEGLVDAVAADVPGRR